MVHLGTVVALMTALSVADAMYMVLYSKNMIIGEDFFVQVILEGTGKESSIDVTLFISPDGEEKNRLVEETVTFTSGGKKDVTLKIPNDLSADGVYRIYMSSTSEWLLPYGSISKGLSAIPRKSNTFIQTDKGIYKARDKVLFRALCLDLELKPDKMAPWVIQIKDPKGQIILLKKKLDDSSSDDASAIISGDMPLSEEPVLGNYTIDVACNGESEVAYFDVLEYVLPKFSVDLQVPGYATVPEETIEAKVTVKYTYGKDVEGNLKVFVNDKQQVNTKIKGKHTFTVGVSKTDYKNGKLNVTAVVSEKGSGVMANDTKLVPLHMAAFAVKTVEPVPIRYKSDKMYTFKVMITDPVGGKLTADLDQKKYQLKISAYTTGYTKYNMTVNVTENPMTIEMPSVTEQGNTNFESEISVFVSHRDPLSRRIIEGISTKFQPTVYKSSSGDGLEVSVTYNSTKKEACVTIEPVKSTDVAFYQVINSLKAEPMQTYEEGLNCFNVLSVHAPKSLIVAYKQHKYGENQEELLIAFTDLSLPWKTEQQVTLMMDPETVRPGESVEVLINAPGGGGGIAALSAADQSLALLSKGNDIDENQLMRKRERNTQFNKDEESEYNGPQPMFRKRRSICWRCGGNDEYTLSPMKVLLDAGMDIMSDITVYNTQFYWDEDDRIMMAAVPDAGMMEKEEVQPVAKNDGQDEPKEGKAAPTVRKDFRETWLWNVVELDKNGKSRTQVKVPDTITGWNVNCFVLGDKGLGVAATEIKVVQPFFLSMNLPYSIVRGEKFGLEIMVFNYKTDDLSVKIQLEDSNDYETSATERTQIITVPADSSGIVVVYIKAKMIGDILLKASAVDMQDSNSADIVERKLLVKAEGIRKKVAKEIPFAIPEQVGTKVFDLKELIPDSFIVEGSLKMYLQVKANLMGGFNENLGAQIEMPYGCGEQNLISLTPAVFIGRYLTSSEDLHGATKKLVEDACLSGYSRQLNYKHADGSFSAFGENGACGCGRKTAEGSTWLTAYVLKMFSIMAYEEFTFVDVEVLEMAFTFLNSKFSISTGWREDGRVIHNEMQGKTSTGPGLTAFCINAILDFKSLVAKRSAEDRHCGKTMSCDELISAIDNKVGKATAVLAKSKFESTYLAAISAYAFAKAGSVTLAKTLLQDIKARNESEPSTNDDSGCDKEMCIQPRRTGYRHGSEGTKAETIGYRLLAYVTLGKKTVNAVEIGEYKTEATLLILELVKLRKTGGTFSSTQATSIGFDATSTFASAYPETRNTDFSVVAKKGNEVVSDKIVMTNKNSMQMIEVKLDVSNKPDTLSVDVEGTGGTAFVTIVAIYNTEDSSVSTFNLKYTTMVNKRGQKILTVGVTAGQNAGLSSMLVVSVFCQSEVEFDLKNIELNKDVQRIEALDECGVALYYLPPEDEAFDSEPISIPYSEMREIENRKKAVIVGMDYYNTTNNKEILYELPLNATAPCMDCGTGVDDATGLNSNIFMLVSTCAMLITCFIM